MKRSTCRPPSLHPRETERDAIACLDTAGNLHWLRVFALSASVVLRRAWAPPPMARRYETPDGSPAYHVDDGLYLVYQKRTRKWLEVEALAPVVRIGVA